MAYKILGQVRPSDTNNADLYTVPAGGQAVISTLHLNNTSSVSSRVTVYARKFDGTLAAAGGDNELVSSVLVSPSQPLSFTIGVTLSAGDVLTVQSEIASTVTFHAFGSESEQ